ncbi:hypothetical protein M9194_07825 [Vibrio sp. S4M6]|uniref:hypothetical protein n=1 Tax=Vibrio sinus TaxID=2946865 RepID=UPI002029D8D1|nr:hypothetical protein [Vibrio sinus]MCL9781333.1 hypothetical protein [Vibrio sinus]
MKRDVFGICLSKSMLSERLGDTFTHIRVYRGNALNNEMQLIYSYPQMSGKEVLSTMKGSGCRKVLWRAEFCCPSMK